LILKLSSGGPFQGSGDAAGVWVLKARAFQKQKNLAGARLFSFSIYKFRIPDWKN
jgi:hypothetical protein